MRGKGLDLWQEETANSWHHTRRAKPLVHSGQLPPSVPLSLDLSSQVMGRFETVLDVVVLAEWKGTFLSSGTVKGAPAATASGLALPSGARPASPQGWRLGVPSKSPLSIT